MHDIKAAFGAVLSPAPSAQHPASSTQRRRSPQPNGPCPCHRARRSSTYPWAAFTPSPQRTPFTAAHLSCADLAEATGTLHCAQRNIHTNDQPMHRRGVRQELHGCTMPPTPGGSPSGCGDKVRCSSAATARWSRSWSASRRRRRRGPRLYDEQVVAALRKVWYLFGCLCGKRLVAVLRAQVPLLEKFGELSLDPDRRRKLTLISAATIDRLLRTEKRALRLRGRSHTKPTTRLMNQIPIRTFTEWQDARPGEVGADLVGHDGGITGGEHAFTLVLPGRATPPSVLLRQIVTHQPIDHTLGPESLPRVWCSRSSRSATRFSAAYRAAASCRRAAASCASRDSACCRACCSCCRSRSARCCACSASCRAASVSPRFDRSSPVRGSQPAFGQAEFQAQDCARHHRRPVRQLPRRQRPILAVDQLQPLQRRLQVVVRRGRIASTRVRPGSGHVGRHDRPRIALLVGR